ncbi:uncharacterized protein LOC144330464 [Macaca mulatta]
MRATVAAPGLSVIWGELHGPSEPEFPHLHGLRTPGRGSGPGWAKPVPVRGLRGWKQQEQRAASVAQEARKSGTRRMRKPQGRASGQEEAARALRRPVYLPLQGPGPPAPPALTGARHRRQPST